MERISEARTAHVRSFLLPQGETPIVIPGITPGHKTQSEPPTSLPQPDKKPEDLARDEDNEEDNEYLPRTPLIGVLYGKLTWSYL